MNEKINVAGVTFKNKDGESRQEILKPYSASFQAAELVDALYKNDDGVFEKAIEVRIKGKCVGFIPRKELDNPLTTKPLTAFIAWCKGKYYVELTERVAPTERAYAYMEHLCDKTCRDMPAYDKRAYALTWATVKRLAGEQ